MTIVEMLCHKIIPAAIDVKQFTAEALSNYFCTNFCRNADTKAQEAFYGNLYHRGGSNADCFPHGLQNPYEKQAAKGNGILQYFDSNILGDHCFVLLWREAAKHIRILIVD